MEWQYDLSVTGENFTKMGRPVAHPKQVQIFREHFSKIPKYGILKMNDVGQLELNTINTKKYKYGTKKGKKKARESTVEILKRILKSAKIPGFCGEILWSLGHRILVEIPMSLGHGILIEIPMSLGHRIFC